MLPKSIMLWKKGTLESDTVTQSEILRCGKLISELFTDTTALLLRLQMQRKEATLFGFCQKIEQGELTPNKKNNYKPGNKEN